MGKAVQEPKETVAEKGQDKPEVKSNKKIKATIYLTEKAEQAFAELYAKRYVEDRKTDRSMIACEAILALYEKEEKDDQ